MNFLGIDDGEFVRGKVPMTKQEIRIITLAKAHIAPNSVIFDIGAGTGSLSIEAARLAPAGKVYAIERNEAGIELIRANMEKFGVANIVPINGSAPEAMAGLPACDAVLIGGSGQQLDRIMAECLAKLRTGGRIVLNCITIQTVAAALAYLRNHPWDFSYEAIQVQVNNLQSVGPYDMAKAANPIYIITCTKMPEGVREDKK